MGSGRERAYVRQFLKMCAIAQIKACYNSGLNTLEHGTLRWYFTLLNHPMAPKEILCLSLCLAKNISHRLVKKRKQNKKTYFFAACIMRPNFDQTCSIFSDLFWSFALFFFSLNSLFCLFRLIDMSSFCHCFGEIITDTHTIFGHGYLIDYYL